MAVGACGGSKRTSLKHSAGPGDDRQTRCRTNRSSVAYVPVTMRERRPGIREAGVCRDNCGACNGTRRDATGRRIASCRLFASQQSVCLCLCVIAVVVRVACRGVATCRACKVGRDSPSREISKAIALNNGVCRIPRGAKTVPRRGSGSIGSEHLARCACGEHGGGACGGLVGNGARAAAGEVVGIGGGGREGLPIWCGGGAVCGQHLACCAEGQFDNLASAVRVKHFPISCGVVAGRGDGVGAVVELGVRVISSSYRAGGGASIERGGIA